MPTGPQQKRKGHCYEFLEVSYAKTTIIDFLQRLVTLLILNLCHWIGLLWNTEYEPPYFPRQYSERGCVLLQRRLYGLTKSLEFERSDLPVDESDLLNPRDALGLGQDPVVRIRAASIYLPGSPSS